MSAVDFTYLETFVAHDPGIVREVLALFSDQARSWSEKLDGAPADCRDLLHTIKGAARGVGANALGDACAVAEAQATPDLSPVRAALDAVVADIAAYQSVKA
ncbi:Hpt domain-containing protein [Phenylobacterium sp.]|jgi:HPt (histidine-containing phosphotransfer) domain-containing protein|uniref:Hpt domain-containing protein n=1 Tax=Phenylobacterium sp. TaxID=1871053 RepID=UPI002F93242B